MRLLGFAAECTLGTLGGDVDPDGTGFAEFLHDSINNLRWEPFSQAWPRRASTLSAVSGKKRGRAVSLLGHTRVELNAAALQANVETFRTLCPGSAFMAVVKSNAYGHGLPEVVNLLRGRTDWFGVNSVGEAAAIRSQDPDTPILIMGRFEGAELPTLGGLGNVQVVVSSVADIEELTDGSPAVPFHLKVDTGMGRLGTHGAELERTFAFLSERTTLPWTGILTHFANVEDVTDQGYARAQLHRFDGAMRAALQAAAGRRLIRHAAASAPALLLAEARLDMVRIGISLYGLWPSRETRISARTLSTAVPGLMPVMRWITHVAHINRVERDACIGYGCTYRADRDMNIAVLPVGYHEGYDRRLSGNSYVVMNNRRARVVGRVCMNMIMADITDLEGIHVGSEAILIGSDERGEPSADYLADQAQTINYEITTRVHAAFPRIIT